MTLSINKLIFSLGFFIILLNGLWEFVGLPTFLVKISFFTILLFVSLVVAAKRKFYVSSFEFYLAFMIIIFFLCTYFVYPNIGTLLAFFKYFHRFSLFFYYLSFHEITLTQNFTQGCSNIFYIANDSSKHQAIICWAK